MLVERYQNICREDSTLRDYQQDAKVAIFNAWDRVNSVMFQMPTGTGKTRLFTSIIHDINKYSISVKQPVKILIIAHRIELIDQIDQSLVRYSVAHGIIAGGQERNLKMPVQVASIQTLTNKNNIEQAKKLNVQFVIIDEAHHSLADTYKILWELFPKAKILGVTATPWRMNGSGFLSLYDKLIKSLTIKNFIDKGWLSVYKYYSLRKEDPIQQKIDSIHELDIEGDYKIEALEREIDITGIRAQLLKSYQTLADGKKGIIYSISRKHSKHICADFEKAGIRIVNIDSETPAAKRKQLVSDFRMGKIDIIVNVDIFSEGFDCPDIEFIQLARPTRSLAKYLQQVGRGLRVTMNKQACIILDNVGLYNRFGLPDANRHWDYHFEGRGEEEPEPPIVNNSDRECVERDFSEGDEAMVLVENLVKEDNLNVASLLANPEELYTLLRKWVIEPNNNSIISLATKVQEDHIDDIKSFFEVIKRVIGSNITADQYLNFIACMLNCDAHVYLNSIANAGYQPQDELSVNGTEMLNALIDIMFDSKKINSAFTVVIPFAKYLNSDSLNKILKRGYLLSVPYQLVILAHQVLRLSPKQSMDYLLSMKTTASYFAIYQVLLSSKNHHKYSYAEIQQIKARIGNDTYAKKLTGRLIDKSVLGVKDLVIENIEDFESGNYDLFLGITSSIQSKIDAKQIDKKTWQGKVYSANFICSYPKFSSFRAKGIPANILVLNEYIPTQISRDSVLPFRILKVFEDSNYTIGCPPDLITDFKKITFPNLIEIGDTVELQFKLYNRSVVVSSVKGYLMIKGKLLYIPKKFNYKIRHQAIVVKRNSFLNYIFVVKDS